MPVSNAMLDKATAAYNEACANVVMVPCERCNGSGYHHGFGEDGASPDWCSVCGGGGYEAAPGEDTRPMRAALEAALAAAQGTPEGWKLVPTKHEGRAGLTHDMCDAFWRAYNTENVHRGNFESTNAGYNAMLAASPVPDA